MEASALAEPFMELMQEVRGGQVSSMFFYKLRELWEFLRPGRMNSDFGGEKILDQKLLLCDSACRTSACCSY